MRLFAVLFAFIPFTGIAAINSFERRVFFLDACRKSSKQPHYILRETLLCDYDPKVRPKLEHTNATNVTVKLMPISLLYDAKTHIFTVNNWAMTYWKDDHLKWNPEDYQDIDKITISSDSIWTPDFSFDNSYHQSGEETDVIGTVDCHVHNDGGVICVSHAKFETLCTADLTYFPFDVQICRLYFGSLLYTGEVLDFQLSEVPFDLDEFQENPEWKLLNVVYYRQNPKHVGNITLPFITYKFSIQRRSSFHEATVITPSLGLLIMCLLVQFMDVREVERFSLTICNIICHIMFIQYISWQVPNIGDSVPRIILFGKNSIFVVFTQLVVTIILRNVTKPQDDSTNYVPSIISNALNTRVGHMVLFFNFSLKGMKKTKNDEDSGIIIQNAERNIENDYFLFAKLIDRLCFVVYLITYLIMFISLIIL